MIITTPVISFLILTLLTVQIQAREPVISDRLQSAYNEFSQPDICIQPDKPEPAPDRLPHAPDKRRQSTLPRSGIDDFPEMKMPEAIKVHLPAVQQASPDSHTPLAMPILPALQPIRKHSKETLRPSVESVEAPPEVGIDRQLDAGKSGVNKALSKPNTSSDTTLTRKLLLKEKPVDATHLHSTNDTLLQQAYSYSGILAMDEKSKVNHSWYGYQDYLTPHGEVDRNNNSFVFFQILREILGSRMTAPDFPAEIGWDFWKRKQPTPRKTARREEGSQEYHHANPFRHNDDHSPDQSTVSSRDRDENDPLMRFLKSKTGFDGVASLFVNDKGDTIYQYQDSNGNVYTISQSELRRLHSQYHESVKFGIAEQVNGRSPGLPAGGGFHRFVYSQRKQKVKDKKLNGTEIRLVLKQIIDESEKDASNSSWLLPALPRCPMPAYQKNSVDKNDAPEDGAGTPGVKRFSGIPKTAADGGYPGPVKKQKRNADNKDQGVNSKSYTPDAPDSPSMETDEDSSVTTVSETRPDYRGYLANSPEDVDYLIDYYRQEEGALAVIRAPDDLLQGALLRHTVVTDGRDVKSTPGQLFNGKKITLLLDFRHMHPAQMAEFNGLFEEKPRCYGKPVQAEITIVSVVSLQMIIAKVMGDSETSPYGDFWRRISQSDWGHQQSMAHFRAGIPLLHDDLTRRVPVYTNESFMGEDSHIETIDFTCNPDWRALLAGQPGLDQQGRTRFMPGELSLLKPDTLVILKGAPWSNTSFTLWLADTLEKQGFQANGAQCTLPDNLSFARANFTGEDVKRLFEKVNINPDDSTPNTPVCLNQCNFTAVMSQSHLTNKGVVLSEDTFSAFLNAHTEIRITSPLSHPQWLTLLNQINRLQDEQDTNITLWVDQPEKQPVSFRTFIPSASFQITTLTAQGESAIHILRSEDRFDVPKTLNGQSPLIIDITPDSQLSRMGWDVLIASMNQRTFDVKSTPFLQALQQGRPVLLRGADSNPDLLQELETLLSSPVPFLWLWGNRIDLPNAQVQLLFTPGASVSSPVWQPLIDQVQVSAGKSMDEQSRTIARRLDLDEVMIPTLFQALTQVKSLHTAMASLPRDSSIPPEPPALSSATLGKIVIQALLEVKQDQSKVLSPRHWRKAVNSAMLKEYRPHREVYSWLKTLSAALFPDTDEPRNRYDTDYLTSLLQDHPDLRSKNLSDYFWQLARGFGSALFTEPPLLFTDRPTSAMNTMRRYLNGLPHAEQRFTLEESLRNIDIVHQEVFQPYNSRLEKTLANAFMSIKLSPEAPAMHVLIRDTARELQAIIDTNDNLGQCKQKVAEHLQQVLFRHSLSAMTVKEVASTEDEQADTDMPAPDLQTLSNDLVTSHNNRARWLERRLVRLADKVRQHRLILLKGDTGAGKSWSARAVARMLNPQQAPLIITVGPNTSDLELFGETSLQSIGEDQQTRMVPNAVLQWAMQAGDLPQILIVDEATLASPHRLDWLNGLFAEQPFISWQGKQIPVSDQHRVILTGNPENFAGRSLHPALREQAVIGYYQAQPYAFMDELIAMPALMKIPVFQEKADWIKPVSQLMETLWQHYLKLLPDRELTPRDMQAITQRIQDYLEPVNGQETSITQGQLNAVVRQSFRDSLDSMISRSLFPELTAFNHWLDVHWPVDRHRVDSANQRFEQYYTNVQRLHSSSQGDPFDFSNEDTKKLAKAMWWDLQSRGKEKQTGLRHNGHHATLIEGPPGRGKDSLLTRLGLHHAEEYSESLPVHINAGMHNWEAVRQAIETARKQGDIVIISEFNLLPGKYLEGVLNQLLDGDFTPGFHLFATINPEHYSGSRPLSPALKNRMSCYHLEDYSLPALSSIAQRIWPESPDAAKQLVQWHWQLVCKLQQHRVKPTASNLVQLLKACRQKTLNDKSVAEDTLKHVFSSQYKLYLLAAGRRNIEDFFEYANDYEKIRKEADASARQELLPAVSQWLHQALGDKLFRPVTVIRGPANYFYPDGGRLEISEETPEPELKTKAIELLAKQQWFDAGLILPDLSGDLLKALFQLWRQEWAMREFGHVLNATGLLFPVNPKYEALLKLPLNQAIVQQARIIFESTSELPSLDHLEQLFQLVPQTHPANQQLASHQATRLPRQRYVPGRSTQNQPGIKRIDGETQLKSRHLTYQKIFDQKPPKYTRMSVGRMQEEHGHLMEINIPMDSSRLEDVSPVTLPGNVILAPGQDYAVFKVEPPFDLWHRLPSASPHERIVAMRAEPACDYKIAYDWVTGQHQVKIAHTSPVKAIRFHYVVEPFLNGDDSRAQLHSRNDLPETMRRLEKLFLQKPALKKQFEARTPEERIKKITLYINGFSANSNINQEGDGIELIIKMIEEKWGVCRHQSWCFYALASCFRIPVRLVSSDLVGHHKFCEYSLDGKRWKTALLHYQADASVSKKYIEQDGALSVEDVDVSVFPVPAKSQEGNETDKEDPTHEAIVLILKKMAEAISMLEAKGETRIDPLKKLVEEWVLEGAAHRYYFMTRLREVKVSYHQALTDRVDVLKLIDEPQLFNVRSLDILSGHRKRRRGTSFSEIKAFLTVMRMAVSHGSISENTWQDALNDALKNMDDADFLLYYYPLIVEQEKWLDQVTGYGAMLRANQLRPSSKIEQGLKNYCGVSKTTFRKPSDGDRPWIFMPDFYGRSESLKNALKLATLEKSFSFEPLGPVDVARLIKREPMFCIQRPSSEGQRSVLVNCKAGNNTWLVRQDQYGELFKARTVQGELIESLLKALVDQYPASAVQEGNNHLLKDAFAVLEKIRKMHKDAHFYNNKAAVTLARELESRFFDPLDSVLIYVNLSYNHYRKAESLSSGFTPEEIDFTPVAQCAKALSEGIARSFCSYLFNTTLAKDGNLQVCHLKKNQAGVELLKPSSVNELWKSLGVPSLPASAKILKNAVQDREALVLTDLELGEFHKEFVASMDIDAFLKYFVLNGELTAK